MVSNSHKNQAKKLDDALWTYSIGFKTPIGMSPYQLVYGKACHLFVEQECKAYSAMKQLNMDMKRTCEKHLMKRNELDEFQNEANKNTKNYKK